MGDVGDFWRDVREARRAAGLPARRSARPKARKLSRPEVQQLQKAGFEQKAEWHWQARLPDGLLDYWPSKWKWQWQGEVQTGTWDELLALVNAQRAQQ